MSVLLGATSTTGGSWAATAALRVLVGATSTSAGSWAATAERCGAEAAA